MKIKDLQGIQSKNPPKFTRKSSPSPTGHIPPMICPAYKLPLNAPTKALTTLWAANGINNPRHNCKAQLRRCRECMAHALLEDKPWRQCPTLAELNSMMLIPGLRRPLFPFQLSDVLRIDQMNGRALVASEMGLGKTITAIAAHPTRRSYSAPTQPPASPEISSSSTMTSWPTSTTRSQPPAAKSARRKSHTLAGWTSSGTSTRK
jgi:hypothetical protein